MASLLLKPLTSILDLIPGVAGVATSSKQFLPVWNFLVSTNEVICHMDPLHPPPSTHRKKKQLHDKKPFLFSFPLPTPKLYWSKIILPFFFLLKAFSLFYFVQPLLESTLLFAKWDSAGFVNC